MLPKKAFAAFVLTLLLCGIGSAHALVLYVSPTGNDQWSGLAPEKARRGDDGPLASLTGARDRIRQIRRSRALHEAVTVRIARGTYFVREPLVLEPGDGGTKDYPVRYEAMPGTRPVFNGGRFIGGWKRGPNGIWMTRLQSGIKGRWFFEQLWVNGRRATRARIPNEGFYYMLGVRQAVARAGPQSTAGFLQTIQVAEPPIRPLAGLATRETEDTVLVALHNWDVTRRGLYGVDRDARLITIAGLKMQGWNPLRRGTRFYLENLRTALDAPGEWFLARNGVLYYKPRPGEDMPSARVVVPYAGKFIVIKGDRARRRFVEHVTFSGLRFRYSQWIMPSSGTGPAQAASLVDAAIMVDGAQQVQFDQCEISHVGGYAIWIRNGNRGVTVRRCLLSDMGAGGVRVGPLGVEEAKMFATGNSTVENNIIRGGGRIFADGVGIWIGQSSDNLVTHNDISDFYYTGISVGWTWGYGESQSARNIISYNRIHHLGQGLLSDLGAVYTLGNSPGTRITRNVAHDISAYGYGGWGIYLDDGSSNIVVNDNLVYNTMSGGFHLHRGKGNEVRNNIFAFGRDAQLERTTAERFTALRFANNIVYWSSGRLFAGPWADAGTDLQRNLYFDGSGGWLPHGRRALVTWQARGKDAGSVIEDPGFAAPAKFDFQVDPESPVIRKIGFQPFDYAAAGVYGEAAWLGLALRGR